jgi:3-methylcrotonyl-CoA carboxylase alpha subunit
MIRKVLIANRGEIARRVLRSCQAQGLATVAVYSDVDEHLPHVSEADESVRLGPARASESYLDTEKILAAARDSGADAVHPGYGFLSESADFVVACQKAGLIFVGPPAEAIELMGDKARARQRMADSGVPVLPGMDQPRADDATLREAAGDIGYPLLIKAVAGGGGKGMRIVHERDAFDAELAAARREARGAFGDDRMLLERYLPSARHVEVQIFMDRAGDAVHLYERDCSVQRRHQKIIEEAPAPGLSDDQREAMGAAAVRAAEAIGYEGAGTVEFLLAPDGGFFFMEMNTRLQVEHPVTELITGQDLVAWQLRVADGHPLPLAQAEIPLDGAALEVRAYAEDPARGFLPSAGTLTMADWPREQARVDTGFEEGDSVSDHYDPMVAKIIAHGSDRDRARRRLSRALRHTRLSGIRHNLDFLLRVLESAPFARAELDTRLLEVHTELLDAAEPAPELLLAAAIVLEQRARQSPNPDPWSALTGWRALGERRLTLRLGLAGETRLVSLVSRPATQWLEIDGSAREFAHRPTGGMDHVTVDDRSLTFRGAPSPEGQMLFVDARPWVVAVDPPLEQLESDDQRDAPFVAPMSGTLVACHVEVGATVDTGQAIITLEAMKMESTLHAPGPGQVMALPFSPGDSVREGDLLVEFEAEAS